MQAGRVDIPTACTICGMNLNDAAEEAGALTCGAVCDARKKILALKPEDRCDRHCPTWAVFDSGSEYTLNACIDCWADVKDPLLDEEVELLPEAENELALANQDGDGYVHPIAGGECTHCRGNILQLWRPMMGEADVRCVECECRAAEQSLVVGPPCRCGSTVWRQCASGHLGCMHCVVCHETQRSLD